MVNRSKGSWLEPMTAACAIAATLMHGDARADCIAPPFELLWMYPADGDTEVPVNAHFWVLTTAWGSEATYTLNSEPLTGAPQSYRGQVIDPGPLEPDTDYLLELRFDSAGVSVTIDFHTQTAEAAAASAPEALGHTTAMQYRDHACADVISAQDCFDTGQDTLLTVQTQADDDALGWLIKREGRELGAVWPSRCGDPSLYDHSASLLQECVLVSKIGAGGLLSEPTQYCPAEHAMSDAAVPEPQEDASVPVDREDAGTVHPLDAGTHGEGDPDASPLEPETSGTGGAGGGDAEGDEAAGNAAPSDRGCSVTSPRGTRQTRSVTSLVWLLGVLAIALRRRR